MNKNKRKILIKGTFSAFIIETAVFFAVLAPLSARATTYSLSSPIPSQTALPHVIQGRQTYATQHIMWRDNAGHINLINSFGGSDADGSEDTYFHYINTSTGAHALVEGGPCAFGRHSVYDSVHNKFYYGGEYCSNQTWSAFDEFDPVTRTNTVIKTGDQDWFGVMEIVMGADNRIYLTTLDTQHNGAHLFSYDPAVGASSWRDYGVVYGPSNGITPGLYVDSSYIYVAWQDNTSNGYWHFMVHPIGSGSWSEDHLGDQASSTELTFHIERNTSNWYLARTTDGGNTWACYWPENGRATSIAGACPSEAYGNDEDATMYHRISMMDYGNYSGMIDYYDYDMNWDDNIPNPSNAHSIVRYGPHSSWNYPTSGFSTSDLTYDGPFYDMDVGNLAPHSGATGFYGFGDSVSDYNYGTQISNPAGTLPSTSVYYAMRVPAAYTPSGQEEFYYSGYPSQAWRWNPALPRSGTNPVNASPSQHMNYRVFMDYDSEGKIWIGSNYCGATAGCKDFGSLAWYDPRNNTNGEIFNDTWTGGNPGDPGFDTATQIQYKNHAMSNNRNKVVVSGSDGKLTVVNAITKTIEGTYQLNSSAWIVEVADDKVLGVTTSSDPAGERVFLFRPSNRTMIIAPHAIGVSGNTFGSGDGHIARRQFKLEKGPDGYAWLYADDKIYRVNPTTLAFELVATDPNGPGKLKWANNNLDLIVYGGTTPAVYRNLLTASGATFSPADLNEDNLVNATDFNILKSDFLKLTQNLTNPKSDINSDGQATIKDVGIMMSGWN